MKRAFLRKGWVESTAQYSQTCSVKWEYSDISTSVKTMRETQFYNHFPDGRELTTKQGLNKNLNAITQ